MPSGNEHTSKRNSPGADVRAKSRHSASRATSRSAGRSVIAAETSKSTTKSTGRNSKAQRLPELVAKQVRNGQVNGANAHEARAARSSGRDKPQNATSEVSGAATSLSHKAHVGGGSALKSGGTKTGGAKAGGTEAGRQTVDTPPLRSQSARSMSNGASSKAPPSGLPAKTKAYAAIPARSRAGGLTVKGKPVEMNSGKTNGNKATPAAVSRLKPNAAPVERAMAEADAPEVDESPPRRIAVHRPSAGRSSGANIVLPAGYQPLDSEPFMNERQRAYFRNKLTAWKDEIVRQNRETLQGLHEDSAQHADIADRATFETDRALELRARDRQRKLISKIDSALARIEDGSYGYCEETGEPIGLKRLDARPIATLSIEAQERHERRERVFREE